MPSAGEGAIRGGQASEQGGLAAGDHQDEGPQRRFGRERFVALSDAGLPPEAADQQPEATLRSPWIPASLEASLKRQPPSDPWALHERIVQLASLRSRLESQISQRLFRFVLDGGPQQAGYRGLPGYAREILGMGERRWPNARWPEGERTGRRAGREGDRRR